MAHHTAFIGEEVSIELQDICLTVALIYQTLLQMNTDLCTGRDVFFRNN